LVVGAVLPAASRRRRRLAESLLVFLFFLFLQERGRTKNDTYAFAGRFRRLVKNVKQTRCLGILEIFIRDGYGGGVNHIMTV
jgi:hypothetical protein